MNIYILAIYWILILVIPQLFFHNIYLNKKDLTKLLDISIYNLMSDFIPFLMSSIVIFHVGGELFKDTLHEIILKSLILSLVVMFIYSIIKSVINYNNSKQQK